MAILLDLIHSGHWLDHRLYQGHNVFMHTHVHILTSLQAKPKTVSYNSVIVCTRKPLVDQSLNVLKKSHRVWLFQPSTIVLKSNNSTQLK